MNYSFVYSDMAVVGSALNRIQREAFDPYFCDTWSPWISNFTPYPDGSERELLTDEIRESLCSIRFGGTISNMKCMDDKGEPFPTRYNITSGDGRYVYSCGLDIGVICEIIHENGICPDYRYSVFCTCDPSKVHTTTEGN